MHYKFKKIWRYCAGVLLSASLLFSSVTVHADTDIETRLAEQREMPIQSNEIAGWPTGPVVNAESAILIEANSGTILYAKNIHKQEYPASTTKILTTLLGAELCDLDEVVEFSRKAIFDNPPGSSGIAMDVGQTLTVEQCLQAILIRSANECAFALAEHISGTSDWSVFAETMNARAKELGAINTHFANPNGLPDENHYTTAYDLAMIGRGFFANKMLCDISISRRLEIPASDTLPEPKIELSAMQIIPGGKYAYEYLIGCKTGYTVAARSSLVSAAEKDGMKLICVVMRDESPLQYEDTIALFNYGFSNFQKINVSKHETKYNIDASDSSYSGKSVFGNVQPLLALDKEDCIILPKNLDIADVQSSISYNTGDPDLAAIITYTYGDATLGTVRLHFSEEALQNSAMNSDNNSEDLQAPSEEGTPTPAPDNDKQKNSNTSKIWIIILIVLLVLFLGGGGIFLYQRISYNRPDYLYANNRRAWKRRKRHRKYPNRPPRR